jgi:hypothetical protein
MLLCGQQLFPVCNQLLGWEDEELQTKPVITCLFLAPKAMKVHSLVSHNSAPIFQVSSGVGILPLRI